MDLRDMLPENDDLPSYSEENRKMIEQLAKEIVELNQRMARLERKMSMLIYNNQAEKGE